MKRERVYKFTCGCTAVGNRTYNRPVECPNHPGARAVIRVVTCPDCGLVFEAGVRSRCERCQPCQKKYAKSRKRDYEANRQPRPYARHTACIHQRKPDCRWYSYCMFRSGRLSKNPNLCHRCIRYEPVAVRQIIRTEMALAG